MEKKKKRADNSKNLISLADRPIEERKAISQKAVIARKINAERRKTIKEVAEAILSIEGNDLTDVIDNENLKKKAEEVDLSIYDMLMFKMIDQGLKGSTKAFETVRDSVGDRPVNKTETDVNIINENDSALLNRIANRLGIETSDVIDGSYTEL